MWVVFDLDQKESTGWGGGAWRDFVLEMRFQAGDVALACFQQDSYYVADHVLQESAALHAVNQAVSLARGC